MLPQLCPCHVFRRKAPRVVTQPDVFLRRDLAGSDQPQPRMARITLLRRCVVEIARARAIVLAPVCAVRGGGGGTGTGTGASTRPFREAHDGASVKTFGAQLLVQSWP